MLYYASGQVAVLEPGLAVIDCGGVGYGCRITTYTAAQLKPGQNARLYITETIREDAHDLYGFATKEEQRYFEMLREVNNVASKTALSILSACTPQTLTLAIMTGDEKALASAPGVGKKTAQRIILELKDKISASTTEIDFSAGPVVSAPTAQNNNAAMAHAALQELGYSAAEVATALKGVDPNATTEEMIRYALRQMVMKG